MRKVEELSVGVARGLALGWVPERGAQGPSGDSEAVPYEELSGQEGVALVASLFFVPQGPEALH